MVAKPAPAQPSRRSSRRTRIIFGAVAVALSLGVVALLIANFRNPASDGRPLPPEPNFTPKPVSQQIPAEARRVAQIFIVDGAGQRNLARAWTIVAPELRAGMTRAQWVKGDQLPFTPIDLEQIDVAPVRVSERFPGGMTLQVAFAPKPGVKTRAFVFDLGLKSVGSGASRRWLVDYWMPRNPVEVPTDNF